ncbi:MAG: chorismate synthase [Thermoplasmata archaeon]|uniref:Chorismate synthase n=1 Tax=Candidatus Sysuiplasma superficiale TaxID=2823368 RepID=A0A8J7YSL3_9ARCH|nr:chorismate synthase [Candidatus Sysuiplasma superficiale]MBX8643844.1 chorismate synthase [Candidatus Sysuiplasma superficiale]MCL4346654.1 chorismate synthase [Candidatus Thermoplasmatota archaeon]
MNSIGTALRLTLFGESHGELVGAVLDGLPAGMQVDVSQIAFEIGMRKPAPLIGTARREEDDVRIASGIKDGHLTGTPLLFLLPNTDVRSASYAETQFVPRPGHADYTAYVKYKGHSDFRGGGQFSGRMTAPVVAAGAVARQFLKGKGIRVAAHVVRIEDVDDSGEYEFDTVEKERFSNDIRCIGSDAAGRMRDAILRARNEGDSVGGIIRCIAVGIPPGLGEPFFDTVEGELSKMIFSIPAVKGIEFGSGFEGSGWRGSRNNDPFSYSAAEGKVVTLSNNSGGINGGITNGMPLVFRTAFKPTSSIARKQKSIDLRTFEEKELTVRGRHDPCIVPRAVIVVEAACCLTLADLYLRSGLD